MKYNKDLDDRNPVEKFCKGDDVMNKNEVIEGPALAKYHLFLFLGFQA